MSKWKLIEDSAQFNKEGVEVERNRKKEYYYESNDEGDDMFDVGRQVWHDHFNYLNVNVDDYGTCKLGIYGDEKTIWTVIRENEIGEFRGIYRLYKME